MKLQKVYLYSAFFALVFPFAVMANGREGDAANDSNKLAFIGRAFDPATGAILYTERHNIQLSSQGQYLSAEVTYQDALNKVFAHKRMQYANNPTLPETYFYEVDSPFSFKVVPEKTGVLALSYSDEQEQFEQVVSIPESGFSVVDAGFDRLVQQQWADLLAGKTVRFNFLAVTRADFYEFRLSKSERSDTNTLVLKLEPHNAVFRWLLDPAFLMYEQKSGRLMRFEGLTNIRKRIDGQAQDENYVAVIEYDYL